MKQLLRQSPTTRVTTHKHSTPPLREFYCQNYKIHILTPCIKLIPRYISISRFQLSVCSVSRLCRAGLWAQFEPIYRPREFDHVLAKRALSSPPPSFKETP